MKKFFAMLLLLAVGAQVSAQELSARVGYGSGTIGSLYYKQSGSNLDYKKSFSSIWVGVNCRLNLKSENWSFNPGIMLTTGGDKLAGQYTVGGEKKAATYNIKTMGIEIPLLLEFRGRLVDEFKFSIGFGPSLYYGLNAKAKGLVGKDTYNFSQNLYAGNENLNGQGELFKDMRYIPKLNRFDFGFAADIALHYKRFTLGYRGRLGLNRIYSEDVRPVSGLGDFLVSMFTLGTSHSITGNNNDQFYLGIDF